MTSLVDDVPMPPLGYLFGGGVDFTNLSWTLGPGEYATPESGERERGRAATLNYGNFIQAIVSFLLIAISLFLLIRAMNRLRREKEPAPAPATPEDVVLLREIRDALKPGKV